MARGRIEYFQQFYEDARPNGVTAVTLLHDSGSLLARFPEAPSSLGQRFAVLDNTGPPPVNGQGVFRARSPIDGVERFGALQTVPGYPMRVIVTRDTSAALAGWRDQTVGSGLRTLALAVMAALLLAVAERQFTRLRTAHQSLAESQERYQLAVAGSNDGIIDWDIANDRMFSSPRAMRIVGIESDQQIRTRAEWARMLPLHPDDVQRHNEELERHLAGLTEVREGDYRLLHPDGVYRWVRVRGTSVRDAQGRSVRWAGSVRDIDEQKRTEEALRLSEERYQLAVAGSNEGLWDWDLKTDMIFQSARAQELMFAQAGEPLRSRAEWLSIGEYHPEDLPKVQRAIVSHLSGKSPTYTIEFRLRHYTGHWHWYRQRGIAVRDETGRAYRMAGSIEDITTRKDAEAARENLEGQLRQAQKLEAIGTLAGGIAHDFNNILSAILGYGELAAKDAPEGSAQRRHIDAAMNAGLRAKSLVERILAFSRSGMGERVPVHVQSVVAEALDGIAASLPAGVRLMRTLRAGDAGVLGDPTQIHQVVMNLCANAVQAIRTEGTITVTADVQDIDAPRVVDTSTLPAGTYLRLEVSDNGSGIEPQVLERIFDPFFTTKEVGVGTGLGLSLVHGIVTDLGGGIAVQSRVGEGSVFTVYLPSRHYVAAPAAAIEAPPPGNGECVLLVDDEEALVRLGEETLAALGYEPVGFSSSVAALAALRADPGRFDLVLTDEAMPGLTGSELAAEIRLLRPTLPIVLMSGFVTPALLARAREAGVADVLAKPLVSRDIARSLAAALRSHLQRQEN
jgi:PAS domain S-box-containing protein